MHRSCPRRCPRCTMVVLRPRPRSPRQTPSLHTWTLRSPSSLRFSLIDIYLAGRVRRLPFDPRLGPVTALATRPWLVSYQAQRLRHYSLPTPPLVDVVFLAASRQAAGPVLPLFHGVLAATILVFLSSYLPSPRPLPNVLRTPLTFLSPGSARALSTCDSRVGREENGQLCRGNMD